MELSKEKLQAFVDRIERLDDEITNIRQDIKEIYAEAKGTGFDTAVLKKLVALMKKDPDDVAEQDEILKLYRETLGV